MKPETLSAVLAGARRSLQAVGCETPALDARLLLQAATGLDAAGLIASDDAHIAPLQAQCFQSYLARRMKHEPVSRILGCREFYGRSFKITPDVLDPRADTECVVALALKHLPRGRFADLGTGSGAIAITLCAENPALQGLACDVSQPALDVARANALALGITSLGFHHGAWLQGLEERFDLIISNPPYIEASATLAPDVAAYDPPLALFGGADGLNAYRAIAGQSAGHLYDKGVVVVEIGQGQMPAVVDIFQQNDFALIDQTHDIAGHMRGLAFRLAVQD